MVVDCGVVNLNQSDCTLILSHYNSYNYTHIITWVLRSRRVSSCERFFPIRFRARASLPTRISLRCLDSWRHRCHDGRGPRIEPPLTPLSTQNVARIHRARRQQHCGLVLQWARP